MDGFCWREVEVFGDGVVVACFGYVIVECGQE